MKKSMNLRSVMNIFYAAAIIIPLILISSFAMSYTRDYIVKVSKEMHYQIIDHLKFNLESFFEQPSQELNALKEYLMLEDEINDELVGKFYDNQTLFHHIRIVNESGTVIYTYPQEDNILGFDFSREQSFEGVTAGAEEAWSRTYVYIKENIISINYAIPMGDNVLIGVIHLDTIKEVFDKAYDNELMTVGITDDTGVYIMHTDYTKVEQRVTDNIVMKQKLDYTKVTQYLNEYYATSLDTDYLDWKIVLYEPVENLKKEINTFILYLSLFILIMVVIALLLGQRFNRVIVQSLKGLVGKTKEVRAGRYDIEFEETNFNELNDLTQNFEAMLLEIKARENRILEQNSEIEIMNSELEARVIDRTDELFAANQELEIALDNLKSTQNQLVESEKLASLGDLVAGLAHEINTPLGIILTVISYLQETTKSLKEKYDSGLLKKSDFEENIKTTLDSEKLIFDNINRSIELMSSFKLISAEHNNLEHQKINVKEFLENIVRSLEPQLKKTNITIVLECDDEVYINTIPLSLYQVIVNLVMNTKVHAYGEAGGLVNVKVKSYGQHLEILVEDFGEGIPKAYQKKVFEPFFTTKRGAGGTGLGLNIVYNTVKQNLKGDIFFNSTEGQGTQFILHLPKE